MDSGVFLLGDDNSLIQMRETPYQAEVLLQQLLEDHPALMAGDQINQAAPREWLHLSREAGIPSHQDGSDQWSLDHLFLDQDAIPTFVEVKRASDTRIRREVVAQMLDYAANATEHWPVQRMREMLAVRCQSEGTTTAEELANALGIDEDEEAFWARADSNLREGRIRLLFVADKIPASLQRIVEYLNRQMGTTEVLAIEVRQFISTSNRAVKTLVPRVIGQTETSRKEKERRSVTPTNTPRTVSLEEFWSRIGPDVRQMIESLVSQAESVGFEVSSPLSAVDGASVSLIPPGATGKPITLTNQWLWISLGRHHPALREEPTNSLLREAILRLDPTCRSAEIPSKSEVGIRVSTIEQPNLRFATDVFQVMANGFVSSAKPS
jgi:hypothetical protein